MHMMRRFRPSEHKFIWGKQVGRLLRTARPKSNPRSSTVNTVAVIEVRPVIPETARGVAAAAISPVSLQLRPAEQSQLIILIFPSLRES